MNLLFMTRIHHPGTLMALVLLLLWTTTSSSWQFSPFVRASTTRRRLFLSHSLAEVGLHHNATSDTLDLRAPLDSSHETNTRTTTSSPSLTANGKDAMIQSLLEDIRDGWQHMMLHHQWWERQQKLHHNGHPQDAPSPQLQEAFERVQQAWHELESYDAVMNCHDPGRGALVKDISQDPNLLPALHRMIAAWQHWKAIQQQQQQQQQLDMQQQQQSVHQEGVPKVAELELGQPADSELLAEPSEQPPAVLDTTSGHHIIAKDLEQQSIELEIFQQQQQADVVQPIQQQLDDIVQGWHQILQLQLQQHPESTSLLRNLQLAWEQLDHARTWRSTNGENNHQHILRALQHMQDAWQSYVHHQQQPSQPQLQEEVNEKVDGKLNIDKLQQHNQLREQSMALQEEKEAPQKPPTIPVATVDSPPHAASLSPTDATAVSTTTTPSSPKAHRLQNQLDDVIQGWHQLLQLQEAQQQQPHDVEVKRAQAAFRSAWEDLALWRTWANTTGHNENILAALQKVQEAWQQLQQAHDTLSTQHDQPLQDIGSDPVVEPKPQPHAIASVVDVQDDDKSSAVQVEESQLLPVAAEAEILPSAPSPLVAQQETIIAFEFNTTTFPPSRKSESPARTTTRQAQDVIVEMTQETDLVPWTDDDQTESALLSVNPPTDDGVDPLNDITPRTLSFSIDRTGDMPALASTVNAAPEEPSSGLETLPSNAAFVSARVLGTDAYTASLKLANQDSAAQLPPTAAFSSIGVRGMEAYTALLNSARYTIAPDSVQPVPPVIAPKATVSSPEVSEIEKVYTPFDSKTDQVIIAATNAVASLYSSQPPPQAHLVAPATTKSNAESPTTVTSLYAPPTRTLSPRTMIASHAEEESSTVQLKNLREPCDSAIAKPGVSLYSQPPTVVSLSDEKYWPTPTELGKNEIDSTVSSLYSPPSHILPEAFSLVAEESDGKELKNGPDSAGASIDTLPEPETCAEAFTPVAEQTEVMELKNGPDSAGTSIDTKAVYSPQPYAKRSEIPVYVNSPPSTADDAVRSGSKNLASESSSQNPVKTTSEDDLYFDDIIVALQRMRDFWWDELALNEQQAPNKRGQKKDMERQWHQWDQLDQFTTITEMNAFALRNDPKLLHILHEVALKWEQVFLAESGPAAAQPDTCGSSLLQQQPRPDEVARAWGDVKDSMDLKDDQILQELRRICESWQKLVVETSSSQEQSRLGPSHVAFMPPESVMRTQAAFNPTPPRLFVSATLPKQYDAGFVAMADPKKPESNESTETAMSSSQPLSLTPEQFLKNCLESEVQHEMSVREIHSKPLHAGEVAQHDDLSSEFPSSPISKLLVSPSNALNDKVTQATHGAALKALKVLGNSASNVMKEVHKSWKLLTDAAIETPRPLLQPPKKNKYASTKMSSLPSIHSLPKTEVRNLSCFMYSKQVEGPTLRNCINLQAGDSATPVSDSNVEGDALLLLTHLASAQQDLAGTVVDGPSQCQGPVHLHLDVVSSEYAQSEFSNGAAASWEDDKMAAVAWQQLDDSMDSNDEAILNELNEIAENFRKIAGSPRESNVGGKGAELGTSTSEETIEAISGMVGAANFIVERSGLSTEQTVAEASPERPPQSFLQTSPREKDTTEIEAWNQMNREITTNDSAIIGKLREIRDTWQALLQTSKKKLISGKMVAAVHKDDSCARWKAELPVEAVSNAALSQLSTSVQVPTAEPPANVFIPSQNTEIQLMATEPLPSKHAAASDVISNDEHRRLSLSMPQRASVSPEIYPSDADLVEAWNTVSVEMSRNDDAILAVLRGIKHKLDALPDRTLAPPQASALHGTSVSKTTSRTTFPKTAQGTPPSQGSYLESLGSLSSPRDLKTIVRSAPASYLEALTTISPVPTPSRKPGVPKTEKLPPVKVRPSDSIRDLIHDPQALLKPKLKLSIRDLEFASQEYGPESPTDYQQRCLKNSVAFLVSTAIGVGLPYQVWVSMPDVPRVAVHDAAIEAKARDTVDRGQQVLPGQRLLSNEPIEAWATKSRLMEESWAKKMKEVRAQIKAATKEDRTSYPPTPTFPADIRKVKSQELQERMQSKMEALKDQLKASGPIVVEKGVSPVGGTSSQNENDVDSRTTTSIAKPAVDGGVLGRAIDEGPGDVVSTRGGDGRKEPTTGSPVGSASLGDMVKPPNNKDAPGDGRSVVGPPNAYTPRVEADENERGAINDAVSDSASDVFSDSLSDSDSISSASSEDSTTRSKTGMAAATGTHSGNDADGPTIPATVTLMKAQPLIKPTVDVPLAPPNTWSSINGAENFVAPRGIGVTMSQDRIIDTTVTAVMPRRAVTTDNSWIDASESKVEVELDNGPSTVLPPQFKTKRLAQAKTAVGPIIVSEVYELASAQTQVTVVREKPPSFDPSEDNIGDHSLF